MKTINSNLTYTLFWTLAGVCSLFIIVVGGWVVTNQIASVSLCGFGGFLNGWSAAKLMRLI